MQYTEHTSQSYSGTPLIWSPMGKQNLAVLIGDCISNFFLQENVWLFCWATKRWP